jgi:hypothetical protein
MIVPSNLNIFKYFSRYRYRCKKIVIVYVITIFRAGNKLNLARRSEFDLKKNRYASFQVFLYFLKQ